MKKTLIALAVAASAVSGSAMAAGWVANGIGGSVDFSGTLNPKDIVTPWEVKVGDVVNDLNASIKKGKSMVDITAKKPVLVLGIRTASNNAFLAQPGIAPMIDFKNAIDLNGFENGVTTLTLEVKDGASNNKIGTLTAPFNTAALASLTGSTSLSDRYTYLSAVPGSSGGVRAFSGGLATDWSKVNKDPLTVINALSADIMANFNAQGMSFSDGGIATNFSDSGARYSAAYGAGILANSVININLDQAVTADHEIAWKAELPVTVSYQ